MKDNNCIPISVSLIEVSGSAQYIVSLAAVFVSSRNAPRHSLRENWHYFQFADKWLVISMSC